MPNFLLIDISNSFTKLAWSNGAEIFRVRRIPTPELTAAKVREILWNGKSQGKGCVVVVCSVVPERTEAIRQSVTGPLLEVGSKIDLGIGIEYPHPAQIGADRLANSVACVALYGAPAVVVDFGTAVTFDVISKKKAYLGGIIAPGLAAMTGYLNEKTALLPHIRLEEPSSVIGKSTRQAMLAGAVIGYRGLVQEIVRAIQKDGAAGKKPFLVATGGHAALIGGSVPIFDAIDPLLTLQGLRLLGVRHFSDRTF